MTNPRRWYAAATVSTRARPLTSRPPPPHSHRLGTPRLIPQDRSRSPRERTRERNDPGSPELSVTEEGRSVPGINFNRLRAEITMAEVLDLLGFEAVARSGVQWYGCCPLHEAPAKGQRYFSANLALGRYYCHRCHSHGNAIELWAAATKRPLYQATIDLCQRLGREVPWIKRW